MNFTSLYIYVLHVGSEHFSICVCFNSLSRFLQVLPFRQNSVSRLSSSPVYMFLTFPLSSPLLMDIGQWLFLLLAVGIILHGQECADVCSSL